MQNNNGELLMTQITRLYGLFTAALAVLAMNSLLPQATAQSITVPQLAPYTNDANTDLLQHFDATTTGTPYGAVFYTNGVFGQGVHLDTSSLVSWNLGALSQGTVEFWATVDTMTDSGGYFVVGSTQPNNWPTFLTGLVDTNHARSQYNDVNVTWQVSDTVLTSIIIITNTWHHYATTWGSKGFHFYVDGTLVYSNAVTLGQNTATTYWSVSANRALGNNGYGFNGVIDELRISNIQRVFVPMPSLSIEVAAEEVAAVRLRWLAASDVNYQVQWSTDMQAWSNLTSIVGSDTETNLVDWMDGPKTFYRLIVQ
jgi:hypothetical protein